MGACTVHINWLQITAYNSLVVKLEPFPGMSSPSVPHEESRKIANTCDITSNHRNTLDHAKCPAKTSSFAQMNGACCDTARKL